MWLYVYQIQEVNRGEPEILVIFSQPFHYWRYWRKTYGSQYEACPTWGETNVDPFQLFYLVGGFNPSEKYESQLGWWNSQYTENKPHVPKHQSVIGFCQVDIFSDVDPIRSGLWRCGVIPRFEMLLFIHPWPLKILWSFSINTKSTLQSYNVRPPSYVCWFISPSNYSYKYHKP